MTYKTLVESIRKIFMSDENTQEVQAGAEVQMGQAQQASEAQAPVETQAADAPNAPVVSEAQVVVTEPVVTEPVVTETMSETTTSSAQVSISYNGQEIVEKLDEVNADGRHCRLADGTTAYVPLIILGE